MGETRKDQLQASKDLLHRQVVIRQVCNLVQQETTVIFGFASPSVHPSGRPQEHRKELRMLKNQNSRTQTGRVKDIDSHAIFSLSSLSVQPVSK